MDNKINKNTTLENVLKCSGSESVLKKYNVPCLSCPFAQMEMGKLEIGDICKNYGIDVKGLIEELNELLKK